MQTGILIYEDNVQLRESLEMMIHLSKDLLLLGSFGHPRDVEAQVRELQPAVILMDIDMPGLNGIEAVRIIRAFDTSVHILMLTVFEDNVHVYGAICAGASGYLLKKHLAGRLLRSIEELLQGEVPMSPGLARMVIQQIQAGPGLANKLPPENIYGLTPKEKEILTSLSGGNSYKMIAAALNISIDTVRTHIKRIYEKLRVHSQVEAVSKANKEGLI